MSRIHFINPYNFVPIPQEKAGKYQKDDSHTGVITYTITTKTPLFIPNSSSEDAFQKKVSDHKSYDFYSYTMLENGKDYSCEYHQPVLPGSELRGMFRNIYETLTDSCMGVLNESMYPVKRSAERFLPALIQRWDKGYRLVAVKAVYKYKYSGFYRDAMGKDTAEGSLVYFNKKKAGSMYISSFHSENPENKYSDSGYLLKGMEGPTKRNYHIFSLPGRVIRELKEEDFKRLQDVIISYQEQPKAENAYKDYQQALKYFLNHSNTQEYFPVYYSILENGNDLFYLSPACITKEVSNHTLGEIAGNMVSCKKKENLCPACDLFGMVGSSNEEAVASSLRFSDAYTEERSDKKTFYCGEVTLQTLGQPKTSNTEFYLELPEEMRDADYWTYDYYTKEGKVYPYTARIRGRKFYWHQPRVSLPVNINPDKMNKTVRLLDRNITFTAKLYYDEISTKQLKQLLWILNGGSSADQRPDDQICYKLGGGKPLGLGSIQVKVQSVKERRVALKDGMIEYIEENKEVEIPLFTEAEFSNHVSIPFTTICSFNAVQDNLVTYPIKNEQFGKPFDEGYLWYVDNHMGYDYTKGKDKKFPGKRTEMKIHQVLPELNGVGFLAGSRQEAPPEPLPVPKPKMETDAVYYGTVIALKQGNKVAGIKLDDGVTYLNLKADQVTFATSKKLNDVLVVKDRVALKFNGTDGSGKKLWICTNKL